MKRAVVIGAGPAGLACAYELVRRGVKPIVLEKGDRPGGLARTETYRGYHFDIGGHRFYTKFEDVAELWRDLMGDDFLSVARLSRIYFRGRFFDYPLRIGNALRNLGLVESLLILASYARARVFPSREEENFEQWVSNRFGRRLYLTFFKTYTEKVWGLPCTEIRADWAAQRIKGLSLATAVVNAILKNNRAKSLIGRFDYPRTGPGLMWQRLRERIEEAGGEVRLGAEVVGLVERSGRIEAVRIVGEGGEQEIPTELVVSSMALPTLLSRLEPAPGPEIIKAAQDFSFRAFIIVGLILDQDQLFPDQWIYVHTPGVKVGRIQNFRNWSADMVPDSCTTNVGMEYFCDEDDEIWSTPDAELIELATRELERLGLAEARSVQDGFVVRQPMAYPVYDRCYRARLETIRGYLEGFENFQTIGRNGMHRYNNMDHAMRTGTLAARNFLGEEHDLWEVNEEEEYLEEVQKVASAIPAELLSRTFEKMDKLALATALGTVAGLSAFVATIWLVIKGGETVGPNLQLLSQYFAGYTVTVEGSIVALGASSLCGFLMGWFLAYTRNFLVSGYLYRIKRKAEMVSFKDFLDQL